MTKTLLAVDDSVTMRKVLEITFSGEDFRVIAAESSQNAIGKLAENPGVIVVDTVLNGEDGYALAKELRKRSPAAAIIMLASRYSPYDQGRGRDAGADDFADKPFDTQQLIDKVKKVLLAKEASGAVQAPIAAPAAAPPPPVPQAAPAPPPFRQPPPMAAPAPAVPRTTQQSLSGSVPGRTGTLVFGDGAPPPVAPIAAARPAVPAAPQSAPQVVAQTAPAFAPAPPPVSTPPAPAVSHVASAVNGHLAGKLGELGLSSAQAEAVLALSREVVERVVWEVVPQLAETLIKEEIARLTRA